MEINSFKRYKSGTRDNPDCQLCGDIETMEHLIYLCPHYAEPLWQELSDSLTTLFEHISGSPVARVHITPKEIIYNKPHPSVILYLHDETARCTILQLMQEMKRDVLYRRMNIRPPQQGAAVPKTRIQAHLIGTVNKLSRLLEYQNLRSGNEAKRIRDKLNEIISARVEWKTWQWRRASVHWASLAHLYCWRVPPSPALLFSCKNKCIYMCS